MKKISEDKFFPDNPKWGNIFYHKGKVIDSFSILLIES